MCLTIPMRVVTVHGDRADVESGSGRREVDVSHVNVRAGDYVLVQGGVAMMVMNRRDAESALAAWDEVAGLDA